MSDEAHGMVKGKKHTFEVNSQAPLLTFSNLKNVSIIGNGVSKKKIDFFSVPSQNVTVITKQKIAITTRVLQIRKGAWIFMASLQEVVCV